MAVVNKTTTKAEKTSLYFREGVLDKLKYISFMERKSQTDIFDEAFNEYISRWEKKNGPVQIPKR
ncbi:MAG: hypothetical protein JWO92_2542 [Chitinophagaceae bacterium]|nr:hypothetical protein [Chitinophagaceae bacterium]